MTPDALRDVRGDALSFVPGGTCYVHGKQFKNRFLVGSSFPNRSPYSWSKRGIFCPAQVPKYASAEQRGLLSAEVEPTHELEELRK